MVPLFRGLAVASAVALAAPALAFHSGGVGACGGCHAMHGGSAGEPGPSQPSLLKDANPTDVCLSCHATENGNTWGGALLVPGPVYGGGSFVFLTEDNLNDGPGGDDPANWIPGAHAGHSVISSIYGTGPDPDFVSAPGGTYPASNLHCTSCHDPHGRGGHFRLLYGSDRPDAIVNGVVYTYTEPAPDADGIPLDGPPESPANHTAYRDGVSLWCANCHGQRYHQGPESAFQHPVDNPLSPALLDLYNRYRGTGLLDGTGSDAYIPEVALEFAGATTDFTGPVATGARVTCLSCHRAHASSGPRSGRWDFEITTWAEEGILSGSYAIPNPYAATAGPAQRRLCDKCHGDNAPD